MQTHQVDKRLGNAALIIAWLSVPFQGLVAQVLYMWFVQPIFHLPSITVAQAVGILVFRALFRTMPRQDIGRELFDDVCRQLLTLIGLLVMGAIVYTFFVK